MGASVSGTAAAPTFNAPTYAQGTLTTGVQTTVLNITGQGRLNWLAMTTASNTIDITVDGVEQSVNSLSNYSPINILGVFQPYGGVNYSLGGGGESNIDFTQSLTIKLTQSSGSNQSYYLGYSLRN